MNKTFWFMDHVCLQGILHLRRGPVSRPTCQLRMSPIRLLFMTAALALQLNAASAAAPRDDLEELDRLQVYGLKPELRKLRQAVIEAEDRFYERYNELNSNDDFDMNCRVEPRTGTRLTRRTCRPLYQEDAVQEGAKQAVELRQRFQSHGGQALLGATSPPVPAAIAIVARRPEFERNMRTLVRENPELILLLQELAAAAEALDTAMHRGSEEGGPLPQTADQSKPSSK